MKTASMVREWNSIAYIEMDKPNDAFGMCRKLIHPDSREGKKSRCKECGANQKTVYRSNQVRMP